MRTYTMGELKVGMKVVFVDGTLNVHPSSAVDAPEESSSSALSGMRGVVVALNKGPGKKVGVCFEKAVLGGHSCDMAAVPPGHGFWVLPEHLYSEESHKDHGIAADKADAEQAEVRKLVKGFLGK
jgi:hypothetical protein